MNAKPRMVLKIVMVAFITVVMMIISRQPGFSLNSLLVAGAVFTLPELFALKLGIGLFSSVVIVSICALVMRTWSFAYILTAILVQLAWIEFEWGFSFSVDGTGEALVRMAEELGIALSSLVFYGLSFVRRVRTTVES